MAYYLTIKKNKEYGKIDISMLPGFKKISKFKERTSYSLEEIDSFTANFDSEYTLKKTLLEYGALNEEDLTKDIEIRYKNKEELVKVRYDLVYEDTAKYFNTDYLRAFILSRGNDRRFLTKLVSFYRNSYCNNENICRIRYILDTGNEQDFTMQQTLIDFVFREIYTIDYKTGTCSLKYKSLHDLAMLCYTYDLNSIREELNISKEEVEANRIKMLNSLKQTKKRTLKKKNYELEGQMSFEDLY